MCVCVSFQFMLLAGLDFRAATTPSTSASDPCLLPLTEHFSAGIAINNYFTAVAFAPFCEKAVVVETVSLKPAWMPFIIRF